LVVLRVLTRDLKMATNEAVEKVLKKVDVKVSAKAEKLENLKVAGKVGN